MRRHLPVTGANHINNAREHSRLTHILGCERAPIDPSHHQRPRLPIYDLGRNPGGMCGALGRKLVCPCDAVHRTVVTDTRHEIAAAVMHDEVGVGDAATQRLGLHRTGPARKVGGSLVRLCTHAHALTSIGVLRYDEMSLRTMHPLCTHRHAGFSPPRGP
jgi:hypothetical protein